MVKRNRKTTKQFITESILKHGYKYDYTKTKYINNKNKVIIICPNHGEFLQRASSHIFGYGCHNCLKENRNPFKDKKSELLIDMINKGNFFNKNKYDYTKAIYKNGYTKLIIICPNHGEFLQTPDSHKRGSGCPKCDGKYLNQDEFIFKCNLKHYNKYDYSLIRYSKGSDILDIICSDHGIFKQKASYHLAGSGCNICYIKSKGEKLISNILNKNDVFFEQQKRFSDCRYKMPLYIDFYLEKLNILIEFNGIQHYQPIKKFGGEKTFKIQKIKDSIKIEYCKKNNIKLLIIMYNEINNLENIINNLLI